MVEILLFAVLSAYLFYRLWSVLGTRTGNEKQRGQTTPEEADNVIVMPRKKPIAAEKTRPVAQEIVIDKYSAEEEEIKKRLADFSLERFERGARNAFKAVVRAFAEANAAKLAGLVGEKVLKGFETAIEARQKAELTLTIEIKNVESEITEVKVEKDRAKISVRFISDQLIVTKNKSGETVENPEGLTNRMIDAWTFLKEFSSASPVWLLVKTESVQ